MFKARINNDPDDQYDNHDAPPTVKSVIRNSDMPDFGYEVIRFTLGIGNMKRKTCVIYFPNTQHVGNHSKAGVTNASLAREFFGIRNKDGDLIGGDWGGWFDSTVMPFLRGIASSAREDANRFSSEEGKKIRKEYNDSIRKWKKSGSAKSFIAKMSKAYGIVENVRDRHGKMRSVPTGTINTVDENGNPIVVPVKEFFFKSKYHKRSLGWTREMEMEYNFSKRDPYIRSVLGNARMTEEHDPVLAKLVVDPYRYGAFLSTILSSAARNCVERIKNFILGAKSPDITDRTKRNRYYRKHGHARGNPNVKVKAYSYTDGKGNSVHVDAHVRHMNWEQDDWSNEGPPLNETGEFANSIQFDII